MATVGNLFVNVRGRTSGLVRDMKKANRAVNKDFYRSQGLARDRYREAIGRVQAARGLSPAIREKRLRAADFARRQMNIARDRPARLARRRELMGQKARGESMRAMMAREAKALIPLVLGVPAAVLAFSVRKGVQAFGAASQMAVVGPQGGRFIEAKVGKILDDMAFAQREDVSAVMARSAELERQNAFLWREVGLQFQIVLNQFSEMLGLDITSPGIKGDEGFQPGVLKLTAKQRMKMARADAERDAAAGRPNPLIPNYSGGFM